MFNTYHVLKSNKIYIKSEDKNFFGYHYAAMHQYWAIYTEEFYALYRQLGDHGGCCDYYESRLYTLDVWRRLRQSEKLMRR